MLSDAYVSGGKVSAYVPDFCEVFFVSLHFVCDITKVIVLHLGILYRWKGAKLLGFDVPLSLWKHSKIESTINVLQHIHDVTK
jgi:hypothetical protein